MKSVLCECEKRIASLCPEVHGGDPTVCGLWKARVEAEARSIRKRNAAETGKKIPTVGK